MTNYAGFKAYKPRPIEKFWRWLGFRYAFVPFEKQEGFADAMICDTKLTVPWGDRLRVLISGRMHVRTITHTENKIGNHKTASNTGVEPPWSP